MKEGKSKIYYLWDFLIFFAVIILFGSGIINLDIKTAHPFVVLSLLVAFSCFASGFSSCIFAGIVTGACVDSIAADSYCFNTLALMLLAVGAYLLSNNVFNKNLKATLALCFLLSLVYYLIHWLVFIAFSLDFRENLEYLLQHVFPSCLYTAVFCIPFFLIYNKLKKSKSEI